MSSRAGNLAAIFLCMGALAMQELSAKPWYELQSEEVITSCRRELRRIDLQPLIKHKDYTFKFSSFDKASDDNVVFTHGTLVGRVKVYHLLFITGRDVQRHTMESSMLVLSDISPPSPRLLLKVMQDIYPFIGLNLKKSFIYSQTRKASNKLYWSIYQGKQKPKEFEIRILHDKKDVFLFQITQQTRTAKKSIKVS